MQMLEIKTLINKILQANDKILQANDKILQANDKILQANDKTADRLGRVRFLYKLLTYIIY
jgi:hypothetical protein